MSYFDSIVVPGVSTPKKTGGNYFDQITLPANQAQANKLFNAQHDQQVAEQQSAYENSFSGQSKSMAVDLGNKLVKVPVDFFSSLYTTYSETPQKIAKSISTGAEDYAKGKTSAPFVAGFRVAGDVAGAIFAPISAAIGAALNLTGGQQLLDKTGQVIADKSGITDIPAFQKFALENPEAGADFERLLNLALAGGEKGKIDPARIREKATEVGQKIVLGNQPTVQAEAPTSNYFDKITTPVRPTEGGGTPVETVSRPAAEVTAGGPEQAVSSRGADVLKAAVEKGLIEKYGDLPTHDKIDFTRQASSATDFVISNPEKALSIIRGESLPPSEILPTAVYEAAERLAIEKGDVNMIQELSKSPVPTLAGQSLKALDSVDPNSPVKILRDIQAELETKVEKKTGMKVAKERANTVKEINREIKEASGGRPTWEKFIEDLTCSI